MNGRDGQPAAPADSGSLVYTPDQLDAIGTIDRNLQIVACAGAGKTQVLAERVAELLRRLGPTGVRPANVVAFTFTERAGAELKDRIITRVRRELGDVPGMAEMYVGTIHGFCLQLLQAHIPEYFKYQVLDEVQLRLLIDRASSQTGLSDLGLKRYVESDLYVDCLSVLREGDVDAKALKDHPVIDALHKFESYLEGKHYLDYTGIVHRAVEAVRTHEDLRRHLSAQVRFLIVDEYQDVNPLQEALVRTLHDLGANVCVVGDDDQTIYQWRGSDVGNMVRFAERYPNVRVVTLADNYRCSIGVVEAARTVIEHNNPDRLPKAMTSTSIQTYERGDLLAREFDSPDAEARWIAETAKSLIGVAFRDSADRPARGLAPSDFAILLRSVRRNGEPIVRALQDAGVPVVVRGMTNLFATSEAVAARALFLFMTGHIGRDDLAKAWLDADVGIDSQRLETAISAALSERNWNTAERWSVYNLQRTYMRFLEGIGLVEELVPSADGMGNRGELVYYNLGKFSQVISDFEQIYFQSEPARKYEAFAQFLIHQAPSYYPEGWQDAAYVQPNAVQVMTVHQAKGMEWPVVFVPQLVRNRFPAKAPGGKNRWSIIPRAAVRNAHLYDGSVADERRLFYVALTRGKKYVFCSWAPHAGNALYRRPSLFLSELTASPKVLTREPKAPVRPLLESKAKRDVANVALSFSELKYFFECPYQFKLRFLYGFNAPLHEALGYGKSLHDALAEVHKRALAGDLLGPQDAPGLVARHLNVPFAYEQLRSDLAAAATKALGKYMTDNAALLKNTEHVEQVVELNLGDGIVVNGRIDLIRRLDTNEVIVIDFKSTARAQEEDVTRTQLHIYTLGYRELTGEAADLIEIYNLDDGRAQREEVDRALEVSTRGEIKAAAAALRTNTLPRLQPWGAICDKCDLAAVCRPRPISMAT